MGAEAEAEAEAERKTSILTPLAGASESEASMFDPKGGVNLKLKEWTFDPTSGVKCNLKASEESSTGLAANLAARLEATG